MALWELPAGRSWHVVIRGGLAYTTLHLLLHRTVVMPRAPAPNRLYKIAHGDNTPMAVAIIIREIHDISDGVDLMLAQFCLTPHDPWGGKLRGGADNLWALSANNAG